VSLGRWQWDRGDQRQAQIEQFARGSEQAIPLGSRSLAGLPRFQRISVSGRFDTEHQFLLDNLTHEGRAGYHVLTPLELVDGRVVLIDRGWLPFTGYRDRLPDVSFQPNGPAAVTGRVDELPSAGLARGRYAPPRDAPWPRVTSYPDTAQLSQALGREVEPRRVLLDAREPNGYLRDWKPPGFEPGRHWSYAIQWWSFAGVLILIWALLSTRKPPGEEQPETKRQL
jgi:surfeit locus 1 family protein